MERVPRDNRKAGVLHVGTVGSQSGCQVSVYLQPNAVTIVRGNDHNGLDFSYEQTAALIEALTAAHMVGVQRQTGVLPDDTQDLADQERADAAAVDPDRDFEIERALASRNAPASRQTTRSLARSAQGEDD